MNKINNSRITTEGELFKEMKKDHGSASKLMWSESKREFLNILQQHLRKDIRVLNVGCGTDNFSQKISHECFYVCSDLVLQSLCEIKKDSGTLSVCGNVLRLPFKDESFDIVFCIDLIHHFATENISVPLKEMFRVTKPDGYMFIEEPNKFALLRLPISFVAHSVLLKLRCLKRKILRCNSGPANYEAPLGYKDVRMVVKSLGGYAVNRIPSYPYITNNMQLARLLSILTRNKWIAKLFGWHWIMKVKKGHIK